MRGGSTPRTGSSAAASVSSTSCQPTSGARAGPTRAPAARAISWAPRQTPSTGTRVSSADWMNAVSPASHWCSASWSGCITPPKTMIASHAPGSSGGASPFAVYQRSRRSPRSTTTRSNNPPPPVGESSWTTERTRTGGDSSRARRLRRAPGARPRCQVLNGHRSTRCWRGSRACAGCLPLGIDDNCRTVPDTVLCQVAVAAMAERAALEERQLGRRRLDAAGRRDARLVEQPSQDAGAPRGEVVAVVVEERVDLLGLVREPRERLDPLRELVRAVEPVEALRRALGAADVPRRCVASVEADVGDAVRRGRDARR